MDKYSSMIKDSFNYEKKDTLELEALKELFEEYFEGIINAIGIEQYNWFLIKENEFNTNGQEPYEDATEFNKYCQIRNKLMKLNYISAKKNLDGLTNELQMRYQKRILK